MAARRKGRTAATLISALLLFFCVTAEIKCYLGDRLLSTRSLQPKKSRLTTPLDRRRAFWRRPRARATSPAHHWTRVRIPLRPSQKPSLPGGRPFDDGEGDLLRPGAPEEEIGANPGPGAEAAGTPPGPSSRRRRSPAPSPLGGSNRETRRAPPPGGSLASGRSRRASFRRHT
jgi:hypothetical protein